MAPSLLEGRLRGLGGIRTLTCWKELTMNQNPTNYFRKQAKRFFTLAKGGDSQALERLAEHYPDQRPSLQRAQHILAIEAGFRSWQTLLAACKGEVQLAAVMHSHPLLCDHGMGTADHWRLPKADRGRKLAADRQMLRGSLDAVEKTRAWLRENVAKIKTINGRAHSYHLKHLAEKEIGRTVVNGRTETDYITNGVLIAAALSEGYEHRDLVSNGSSNVEFAISERSLKAIRKRQGRY
jgi:hypothetical protein